MRYFLSLDDVLGLHGIQIRGFGGAIGLRDKGQLQSAVARPQTGYYKDIIEEAAALWESLSQNHPFVDGNKRTAIVATIVFLELNDWRFSASDADTYNFVKSLYESANFQFDQLVPWLRENCHPV